MVTYQFYKSADPKKKIRSSQPVGFGVMILGSLRMPGLRTAGQKVAAAGTDGFRGFSFGFS